MYLGSFDFVDLQTTLQTVERNINEMLLYQHFSRASEARDYNLITDNNSYVMRWSIMQVVVIVSTIIVQVYFVRKLFDSKTGSSRSRL